MDRLDRRWLVLLSGFAYLAITVARIALDGGPNSLTVLYVVPIAMLGIRDGLVGGTIGFAVGTWLLVGILVLDPAFGVVGAVVRIVAFAVAGPLLGAVVDRRIATIESR